MIFTVSLLSKQMSKDKPMKEEFKTVRRRDDVKQHLKKFVKKQEPKVRGERERVRDCSLSLLFFIEKNTRAVETDESMY